MKRQAGQRTTGWKVATSSCWLAGAGKVSCPSAITQEVAPEYTCVIALSHSIKNHPKTDLDLYFIKIAVSFTSNLLLDEEKFAGRCS